MKDRQISRAGQPASESRQPQTNPSQRILVVDDDIAMRQLSTEVLIHSGYKVDAAEDGAAAWQALNTDCYDLLITDQNMPNLTGVELLKKLRAARMALPVIMVSGTMPQEEFMRYPWLQPAATLLKPYAISEFVGTVEAVLRAIDDTPSPRESSPAAGTSAYALSISQGGQIAPPPDWQPKPPANRLRL